ncbi:hypothetical protein HOG98_08840 [bacterium]|jgi:ankyrin repeat protein|nr:hypothetical protein [bacterium]
MHITKKIISNVTYHTDLVSLQDFYLQGPIQALIDDTQKSAAIVDGSFEPEDAYLMEKKWYLETSIRLLVNHSENKEDILIPHQKEKHIPESVLEDSAERFSLNKMDDFIKKAKFKEALNYLYDVRKSDQASAATIFIEELVQSEFNLNKIKINGHSLLLVACVFRSKKGIDLLEQHGYNFSEDTGYTENHISRSGLRTEASSLYIVVRQNLYSFIPFLKQNGYNVANDRGKQIYGQNNDIISSDSCLFAACQTNSFTSIKALKEAGYNIQGDDGMQEYGQNGSVLKMTSNFYIASYHNFPEVIIALESNGFLIRYDLGEQICRNRGLGRTQVSSLFIASHLGCLDAIEALIAIRVNPNTDKGKELFGWNGHKQLRMSCLSGAIEQNNVASFNALLTRGCDIQNDFGTVQYNESEQVMSYHSCLFTAASKQSEEIIQTFIDRGVDIKNDVGLQRIRTKLPLSERKPLDVVLPNSSLYRLMKTQGCSHSLGKNIRKAGHLVRKGASRLITFKLRINRNVPVAPD